MPMHIFHRLHHPFGQRGMRMNHLCHTGHGHAGMHRQRRFMDEIGGMRPKNVHAENPVGRSIRHNLHQSLNIARRLGLSQSPVAEASDFHALLRILPIGQTAIAGLLFRQPYPTDFG